MREGMGNMEDMYLEMEAEAPEGWQANAILRRGANGKIIEVDIPDDTEEAEGDA